MEEFKVSTENSFFSLYTIHPACPNVNLIHNPNTDTNPDTKKVTKGVCVWRKLYIIYIYVYIYIK